MNKLLGKLLTVSCFRNVPFFGLVVEVNSLFADHRMTEQSLRVSAMLKYGGHIEFVNLNPGLSQMSSFHVQKHGHCKVKGQPARDTELFHKVSVISMFKRDLKETSLGV